MGRSIAIVLFSSIGFVGCGITPKYQCDQSDHGAMSVTRFEINHVDGTVFDSKTQLTWKICAEGQSYSKGRCSGKPTRFAWNGAIEKFGGSGDAWRLPNFDELTSLIENRCMNPAIDREVFPDSPALDFWSSSIDKQNTGLAYLVSYKFNGSGYLLGKLDTSYVRLVRGMFWSDPLNEARRKQEEERIKQTELEEQKKREEAQETKQKRLELERATAQAEKDAYIICKDKITCDKAFSLTQIFISTRANQKIQLATDTIIETYNPVDIGNIGMSATKIPGSGDSALIRVAVVCKIDDGGILERSCAEKRLNIYNEFRPFIESNLIE